MNKDLTVLEPQRTLSKDEYIGNYVFATKNRLYALMYLAPNAAGTKLMEVHGNPYMVINGTVEAYQKLDKGGAIYSLPYSSFEESPQAELGDSEYVSRTSVTPLGKETYDSSLTALLDAGVAVYFMDDVAFAKIVDAGVDSRAALKEFEPYTSAHD